MHVWSGAASSAAQQPHLLPMPNFFTLAHRHTQQMTISGPDAVPMIDFHHLTIAALLSGEDNRARCSGIHRGLSPTSKVES